MPADPTFDTPLMARIDERAHPEAMLQLGERVATLRRDRGLSLSQLSERTHLAKSNLSRLERGSANPTLETLWRLATELRVPFSTLIASTQTPFSHEGVTVQLIDQGRDTPLVDAWWMQVAPNACRYAEPHTAGSHEYLSVLAGELSAGLPDALLTLGAGDRGDFPGDRPHLYQAGPKGATLLATLVYGGGL